VKQVRQLYAAQRVQPEGPTESQGSKLAGLRLAVDDIVYGLYGLSAQERSWVMQRTARLRGS
jgi:hypothetical protein